MLNDAIRLGDKLRISQIDAKTDKEYLSKLLDMKEDGSISVAMPIEKNQIILLEIGLRYRITFYTERGLFQCEAKVVQRYKTHSIYVAVLEVLTPTQKVQRREYFRLQCVMKLEFCVVSENIFEPIFQSIKNSNTAYGCTELQMKIRAIEQMKDMDAKDETHLIEMKKAIITDISGGGIRFRTKDIIEQKKDIYLVFSLNQGLSYYRIFGEIISSEKVQDRNGLYDYRVMFSDISSDDREDIIRYILNEERRLRQKEKGFC